MRDDKRTHPLHTDVEVVVRLTGGKSLTLRQLADATARPREGVRRSLLRLRRAKMVRQNSVNSRLSRLRGPTLFALTEAGEALSLEWMIEVNRIFHEWGASLGYVPKKQRAAEKWRARALEDLA